MPVLSSTSELGQPGTPDKWEDGLHSFNSPEAKQLDLLGRKDGKSYPDALNDDLPAFMKESAVTKETTTVTPSRGVTLLRDHILEYPCLCMNVYVEPDPDVMNDRQRFAKMFVRAGCKVAKTPADADLVVFSGGSDVNPALYHETRHSSVYFDDDRDQRDMQLYLFCLEHGIPMLGICRGAQFLHVMNGGKLFQDVDGHYGDHSMFDLNQKKMVEVVSSVHHQMVRNNVKGGMEILATCAKSHERATDAKSYEVGNNADIEAFWYRDTGCLGIQGHPEYEGYNYFTKWCLDLINELIFENPDYVSVNGQIRMKDDLLKERMALANLPVPQAQGN